MNEIVLSFLLKFLTIYSTIYLSHKLSLLVVKFLS